MAKSLKEAGMRELDALTRRTRRQLALKRIGRVDHDYIIEHLQLVETRIVNMEEEEVDPEWP